MNAAWKQECEEYLSRRTGTYEFRCRRYFRVGEFLKQIGMAEWDVLYDLGAGMCELDRYLRENGQHYRYVPIDGCIDGTDLNDWILWETVDRKPEAYALVEVIEHLRYPYECLAYLQESATKGIVLTTPNPDRVDVLGMDPTHQHEIHAYRLEELGFDVYKYQLFNDFEDTLVATWRRS